MDKNDASYFLHVTKISARRAKYQIYLNISEPKPNFCACEAVTKISASQTEMQNKPIYFLSKDEIHSNHPFVKINFCLVVN